MLSQEMLPLVDLTLDEHSKKTHQRSGSEKEYNHASFICSLLIWFFKRFYAVHSIHCPQPIVGINWPDNTVIIFT